MSRVASAVAATSKVFLNDFLNINYKNMYRIVHLVEEKHSLSEATKSVPVNWWTMPVLGLHGLWIHFCNFLFDLGTDLNFLYPHRWGKNLGELL